MKNSTVIANTRDQHYKQAVTLAKELLVPEFGEIDEFLDIAIRAANACAKYCRIGRLRMYMAHAVPAIEIMLPHRTFTPPAVEELLCWATPTSVMIFLAQASGIATTQPTKECPF